MVIRNGRKLVKVIKEKRVYTYRNDGRGPANNNNVDGDEKTRTQ